MSGPVQIGMPTVGPPPAEPAKEAKVVPIRLWMEEGHILDILATVQEIAEAMRSKMGVMITVDASDGKPVLVPIERIIYTKIIVGIDEEGL